MSYSHADNNTPDTPETNAEWKRLSHLSPREFEPALARLARKLERERNLAKGQAIYWQDKATQFAKERDELLAMLERIIPDIDHPEKMKAASALVARIKGGDE